MAKNFPIRIIDLKYQRSTAFDGEHFGAFQVTLSNGISSPVINASTTNGLNMQSFNVSNYSRIKRVNGSKQNGGKNHDLRCLIFNKRDGTQIAKVETLAGYPYDTEFLIGESEEIIGIFGYKGGNCFNQLGFLVWTPPHL
jgi:hypothetical protein